MQYILPIVLSVVISLIGLWAFRRLGILDKPGTDLANTRKPVPTIQGVFVFFGFIAIIALCNPSLLHSNIFR